MATKTESLIIDIKVKSANLQGELGGLKVQLIGLNKEIKQTEKQIKDAFEAGNFAQASALGETLGVLATKQKVLTREVRNAQSTLDRYDRQINAQAGSYEFLLQQYELAQVELKTMANQYTTNSLGVVVLTEEHKKAAAEVKKLKDGIDAFNRGIGDGRSTVGQYAEAIKQAFSSQELLGSQGKIIANAFKLAKGGADLFKGGITGISTAIKASPIGLFTTALELFQGLMKRNSELLKIFRIATAALGEIFNTVVGVILKFGKSFVSAVTEPQKIFKGLVNYIDTTVILAFRGLGKVITAIFTLDISQLKSGIDDVAGAGKNAVKPVTDAANAVKDFTTSAVEATKSAIELSNRTKALEDRERDFANTAAQTKFQVEDLIKQAKERTVSADERLKLLNQAAELERGLVEEEKAIAKERVEIIKEENKRLKENGQLGSEAKQKLVDAEVDLTNVLGESANKQTEIENKKALIISEINKRVIEGKIAALNSEITAAEIQGKETINLRKRIAAEEKNVKLQELGLSNAEILNIEQEYRNKLLVIDKEYEKQKLKLIQDAEDIKTSLILNEFDRETVALTQAYERRLKEIKGNTDEEIRLRELLAVELADAIRKVEEKRGVETNEKTIASIERNAKLETDAIKTSLDEQERFLAASVAKKEITQKEADDRLIQAKLRAIEQENDIVKNAEAQKLIAFEASYQAQRDSLKKQYEEGIIPTKEAYDTALLNSELAHKKELEKVNLESTQVIQDADTKYLNERNALWFEADAQLIENEKRIAEIRKELNAKTIDAAKATLGAVTEILNADEEGKKKNAGVLKALALVDITLNSIKEISGYWAGVGKDASTTGVYGAIGSAALAGVFTAAAVVRAATAIANINKTKTTFAKGGYTGNGIDYDSTGHKVAGVVHDNEYVVPKWMIKNPTIAPHIQRLEEIRKTGRPMRFADGGFTNRFITQTIQSGTQGLTEQSVVDIIKRVQIVASAEEITSTQLTTQTIQSNAEI